MTVTIDDPTEWLIVALGAILIALTSAWVASYSTWRTCHKQARAARARAARARADAKRAALATVDPHSKFVTHEVLIEVCTRLSDRITWQDQQIERLKQQTHQLGIYADTNRHLRRQLGLIPPPQRPPIETRAVTMRHPVTPLARVPEPMRKRWAMAG